jgi:hypothetical protein
MKQLSKNGISYVQFDNGAFEGTIHAFFTRKGGISPSPWNSLNLGSTVGDSRENVIENRKRIFDLIGKPVESLFDVWQVHSTDSICTRNPRKLIDLHQKADAIFTDRPEITLLMRFADCVPILLYDPTKGVIGIVHAGWQGTVKCIVKNAIATIQKQYHVNPADLVAGIGPSIGPDHYAVGDNVYQAASQAYGDNTEEFFSRQNGSLFFDLWKANGFLLKSCGVENIIYSNICTACNTSEWFSHRAENGKTGRFAAIIALRE